MKIFFEDFINEDVVYHGSPYDFDYFTSNMIGQGEGASGWGYGLYFSEDIDDAKDYAKKLEREKGEARLYKVKIPNKDKYLNISLNLSDQSPYVKDCLIKMSNKKKIKILAQHNDFDFEEFKNDIYNNIEDYSFEIDSAEYKEYLQEILDSEFMDIGNDFYNILKELNPNYNNDDEYYASKLLYKLGIKGNIHKEFGHWNYVVFNDDDIQILKKTKPKFKY
jgi:hypothetical protein